MTRFLVLVVCAWLASAMAPPVASETGGQWKQTEPSAQEALAFFLAGDQARASYVRYLDNLEVERFDQLSAQQVDELDRFATKTLGPFYQIDTLPFASVIMKADEVGVLERSLAELFTDTVKMILGSAVRADVEIDAYQTGLLLALLEDGRSPLDTGPPELQYALADMRAVHYWLHWVEAPTVAETLWPEVFALITPELRGELTVAALSGQGLALIRERLIDALGTGFFPGRLIVDVDWVLEQVAVDPETWMPRT